MSQIEVPRGWDEVIKYAQRIEAKPAFISHIRTYRGTNSNTLHRVCMQDAPPLLPGFAQNMDYTRAYFETLPPRSNKPRSDVEDRQFAALRRGLWLTFLESEGRIEANIHPDALTYRPGKLGGAAMRGALEYAEEMASHANVELRIRKSKAELKESGGEFVEQAGTWRLVYPDGPGTGPAQPTMTVSGIPSVLPIEGREVVPVMEEAWNVAHGGAHDAAISLDMLQKAIEKLPSV